MIPPVNNVREMLIVPPRSFFAKISPKTIQRVKIIILERNITLAFDSELLKNKYSKIADKTPANKPKIQLDFCIK
jgi:hypothetical protein